MRRTVALHQSATRLAKMRRHTPAPSELHDSATQLALAHGRQRKRSMRVVFGVYAVILSVVFAMLTYFNWGTR